MIGLDTNILIRYVLRDDEKQFQSASQLIEGKDTIIISLLTLQESEWVLRACAKLDKLQIITLFKALLETYNVTIQSEDVFEQALLSFENGSADFSDCLMVAQYRHIGCEKMVTFDKNAAKVDGVILLA
ncbi:PIN domain-containing protein [Methylotenera sp.]|jgi:predicted nucleic-acid-binding protein|uniref:PIN domain-containing protein n=1 Tax=Methylotenera sp. TaxID=2051956 RepID=UPI00271D0ACB|nr:type II toxin-antitoxin system VapC family toxin [Methylotenera sp.]MDO9203958.1 type II toxin-antitoxin system VapC family toxin [Methylotenera sp.]MDO9393975.1 type II toxin-antitoxin system VapC family toxin [Methylotenera sp.]MDP1522413.1 type II toxin-antitoxin system VapC family toxin [Methylotenera sp.]MDP2072497.1 type II toxin-antitoxin system VapC family toxin [Methylotenera sp.]MDP2229528.1 type II toxin-antitoxin system VapC family toxin [Methylotenera sp.]